MNETFGTNEVFVVCFFHVTLLHGGQRGNQCLSLSLFFYSMHLFASFVSASLHLLVILLHSVVFSVFTHLFVLGFLFRFFDRLSHMSLAYFHLALFL